jgi:cobalt transporter subunit CbtA
MEAFRRIVMVGGLAGLLAGILLTLLHLTVTVPIILEAETYEQAAVAQVHAAEAWGHAHDAQAWAPEDGIERALFTLLADIITAVGFGLLLVATCVLAGRELTWREGLHWGLAGFAAFVLAPAIGLPPELPGMEAAPLLQRQAWWLATVAATAGGLALLFLGREPLRAGLGLVLLVLPHLYGAPQPMEHHSLVPAALAHQFVSAALVVNLLFWAALGAIAGLLCKRFGGLAAIDGRGLALGQEAG